MDTKTSGRHPTLPDPETMTQGELLALCRTNDPNGEYGEDWSAEELRVVVRLWIEEEGQS